MRILLATLNSTLLMSNDLPSFIDGDETDDDASAAVTYSFPHLLALCPNSVRLSNGIWYNNMDLVQHQLEVAPCVT
jgi:hypothetical protein